MLTIGFCANEKLLAQFVRVKGKLHTHMWQQGLVLLECRFWSGVLVRGWCTEKVKLFIGAKMKDMLAGDVDSGFLSFIFRQVVIVFPSVITPAL